MCNSFMASGGWDIEFTKLFSNCRKLFQRTLFFKINILPHDLLKLRQQSLL